MNIYQILTFAILSAAFLCAPFTANAQKPRFEDPARIQKLCEHSYNGQRKTKDCACFVEKYKAKELEMFNQRGTGTVPSYDNVFRLIDSECHVLSSTGDSKMQECKANIPVSGLDATQADTYCKCVGKTFSEVDEMFKHMPNADAAQKKQITEQMDLAARHKCKEQALRRW